MAVPDSQRCCKTRNPDRTGVRRGGGEGWGNFGTTLKIPYSLISLFCNVKMRKSFGCFRWN